MSTVAIRTKEARVVIISKRIDNAKYRFMLKPFVSDDQWYSMPKKQWKELISGNALVAQKMEDGLIIVKDAKAMRRNASLVAAQVDVKSMNAEPLKKAAPAPTPDPDPDPADVEEPEEEADVDDDQESESDVEAFIQDLDAADPDVKDKISDYAKETFGQKINRAKTVPNMIEELRSLNDSGTD